MFIQTTGRQPVCQTFDQKANSLPVGLANWNRRPPGQSKTGFMLLAPWDRTSSSLPLEVATVEYDQGAAVCRPARHIGEIDATLQPSAVKGDIVGTEPFKTPAKRSLKKTHMACGSAEANST